MLIKNNISFIILCICISILYGNTIFAYEVSFTQGSMVNLRKTADVRSKIIAKLPIGSSVSVSLTRGEWVFVDVNSPFLLSGWLKKNLLGKKPPEINELLSEYKKTPSDNIKLRRKWLERAAALEPWNPEVLTVLLEFLTEIKDIQAAEIVKNNINYIENPEAYIDKNEKKVVFLYQGQKIVPLAIIDDGLMVNAFNSKQTRDEFTNYYYRIGKPYNFVSEKGIQIAKIKVVNFPPIFSLDYSECSNNVEAIIRFKGQDHKNIYNGFVTNIDITTDNEINSIDVSKTLKQLINITSINTLKEKNRSWQKEKDAAISIIDIEHDGVPEIITIKKFLYNLDSENEKNAGYFVILMWKKGTNEKYSPVYKVVEGVNKNHYEYIDSYKLFGTIDIDSDGVDEIITYRGIYEGSDYNIHTFKNGKWTKMNIGPYYGPC